jgi:hypothetical protein
MVDDVLSLDFKGMDSKIGRPSIPLEKRSNQTHASTTDPDAKLYRKANGQSSRMAFIGHTLMENRNALVVGALVTEATGTAEREGALNLLDGLKVKTRVTLGAEKGYDARELVQDLRARTVTPHIARNAQVSETGLQRLLLPKPARRPC